jgi:hypothetical protein
MTDDPLGSACQVAWSCHLCTTGWHDGNRTGSGRVLTISRIALLSLEIILYLTPEKFLASFLALKNFLFLI